MAIYARKFHICLLFSCKSNLSLYRHLSSNNTKEPTLVNDAHKVVEFLIDKYHFSPETGLRISSRLLKNPQNSDSVLSFFIERGFSDTQLDTIVRRNPVLLRASLVKITKPKIKIFEDFSFSADEIVEIVSKNPSILNLSAKNVIMPSLTVLKGLLSHAQVIKLLTVSTWNMFVDVEKTLVPNIEFLKRCGLSMDQIHNQLCTYPSFFMSKPEKMKKFVHKVDEMGVERTSKLFFYAVRAVSSMSDAAWDMKLKTFQDLGFTKDDISRVLRKSPVVLSVSERKIKMIKDVLLETGKYDMACILDFPMSFSYSVEKRYIPRLQILKDLERRGLIDKWPSLATLCCMKDDYFLKKFVVPNDDEGCNDSVERVI